ncbi:KamA family radical SAM protein [Bdellovibrio reynosensis]|uniref:KamA family radical SAM protein n=1 Tax=Bdellovibrio reynosensis TaxID=2835041 RepID=A0ABY4CB62_9BACT|nr:KamA family radical SAM protein [Bdellovibrio reynosensis]UOF00916.1 KamA family radical SAM protein [Bdellovibrio reynosensis]
MKFHFPRSPKPPEISESDWNNWTWQLRHSLKTQEDFESVFALSADEKAAFQGGKELFNIRTTPYYASLAQDGGSSIRQILMPHKFEIEEGSQQMLDPLGEKRNNPAPRIIHRYSDRALFLVTDICSVYCRFCTRKHFTGQEQAFIKNEEYEKALAYIKSHPGIREVILSGGDPLTISDAQLDRVLSDLRRIDHVEIIRIGSRMPVVCPMRVTDDLVKILKKNKPVFLMSHFNHPNELTAEAAEALEKFVDNGVPVMNQMVLLNGINNHPALIQALNRRLLYLRVKPYYMFQCDPSMGTDHLRTSIEDSLEIQKELWGHLSGLAMPNLSVDIPNGGGKTYLVPNFETKQEGRVRHYLGWDGVEAQYVSPAPEKIKKPDISGFEKEWSDLKNSKR